MHVLLERLPAPQCGMVEPVTAQRKAGAATESRPAAISTHGIAAVRALMCRALRASWFQLTQRPAGKRRLQNQPCSQRTILSSAHALARNGSPKPMPGFMGQGASRGPQQPIVAWAAPIRSCNSRQDYACDSTHPGHTCKLKCHHTGDDCLDQPSPIRQKAYYWKHWIIMRMRDVAALSCIT